MLTKEELLELLGTTETVRLEKTVSTDDRDKFCAAICAFANDMPGEGRNGYLLIGVHDDGRLSGLRATDRILKDISSLRNDGNILPLPVMNVGYVSFDDGDVIVVEVTPSILPPVRYRGRTWIRVGPRKGIATIEEENILIERRRSKFPTFDTMPCPHAKLEDLDLDLFRHEYLPKAFDEKTIAADTRSVDRQLEALNFYSTEYGCPTYAGLILFGRDPRRFMPGNYIQYVEFSGPDRASDPINQHEFAGPLVRMLAEIDVFVKTSIAKNKPVPVSALREKNEFVYPVWSIRELVMNAIMHRDYQSTGPTKFYQFPDRLEITNSGGLYGRVNAANFPDENDYRNPIVAEAIKVLGYVNRFGRGIGRVQSELASNGNAPAAFHPDIGIFKVIVLSTLRGAESILTTGQSIPFAAENRPLAGESIPLAAEVIPFRPESILSDSRYAARRSLVEAWANAKLSSKIRVDARKNMVNILCVIGINGSLTQEVIGIACGLSLASVKKVMGSLQDMGLVRRSGNNRDGDWELVGFEKEQG